MHDAPDTGSPDDRDPDVLVVGAGSAGAAVAWQLARQCHRVLLVDRRAAGASGARWMNAVPAWCFDAAGIARPSAAPAREAPRDRGARPPVGAGSALRGRGPGAAWARTGRCVGADRALRGRGPGAAWARTGR